VTLLPEDLAGRWMRSLGFDAPATRPIVAGVVECAGVIIYCPQPDRSRRREAGDRWEWFAKERGDFAVLAPLAYARTVVRRADACGIALYVVEPSGTTRAANDNAVDLQAALVERAVAARARALPPIVPCPLCKTPFSDSDGYRLHLDAAHGLIDEPGARTTLPVPHDAIADAISRVDAVEPPTPLVLTPARPHVLVHAVARAMTSLTRAARTHPELGVENPQTRDSSRPHAPYGRVHKVRWGHG
jgi:hypothetical protein